MTLLSLIVPVYRVEDYLEECLDSIFGQSFTDFEVVAVDDASDDGSSKILAWYAEREPRLRVVTLPGNGGLGNARNVGIGHARGLYVWCVDSDDWLPEGTLGAVAERLLGATGADLLVTGYARVFPGGVAEHHPVSGVAALGEGLFTFAERPELLEVLWIACNKVIRRAFLAECGIALGPGWYEDIAFVVPLMLAADRIAVLDRYCYAYRQRPAGAITQTVSDRHFEVFNQWERVFAFLDGDPDRYAGLRPLIFERMVWHCLQVLGHSSRVPRSSRREYFSRVTKLYRRFLPAGGYRVPGGNEGVKQRLVAVGAYRVFEMLMTAWQARGRLVRVVRPARPRSAPVRVPARMG